MNAEALVVLIVASIDFLIAVIFYLQTMRDAARTAYAFFAFAVALWGWSVGLFLIVNGASWLDFLARLLYFSGGLIAPAFYCFTLVFGEDGSSGVRKRLAIFLPTIILFFAYFFTNLIISGVGESGGIRGFMYGPLHFLFDLQLWGFFVLALRELLRKYKNVAAEELKTQIIFITLGTYLVLAVAGVTNVAAPLFSQFQFIWIGPVATIIWIGLVAYALVRHQLLNAKVIATEFFVSIIWLFAVVETVLSQSNGEFLRKFLILVIGSGIFGYFLIKSVFQEIRSREEIERLAKGLEAANEELKKLDAAKSEFISLAGHQLRTPLTAIKGYTSLFLEGSFGNLAQNAKEALDRIFSSTNQLIKLVADLLDLSRIEAGKFQYIFKNIFFDDVIGSVINELKPIADEKHIAIEFQKNGEKKFGISADANKMHELVINLLDNALKYSDSGSIKLVLKSSGRKALLSIEDKGIGISKEDIPRLFTKFARSEEAKKARPDGMGLGLYFIKKIAEDHGGKVWAESAGVGKGSTFYVELPLV